MYRDHIAEEEQFNEGACIECATFFGHTKEQALDCDEGELGCPLCPWKDYERSDNMKEHIVTVFARRWNDTHGNTYHSVKVYYDGNIVNKDLGDATEIYYGYDRQWETTALNLLYRHGIYEEKDNKPQVLRRVVEEQNNDKLVADCADVSSKKELYFYY